jgi:hypothetical protein
VTSFDEKAALFVAPVQPAVDSDEGQERTVDDGADAMRKLRSPFSGAAPAPRRPAQTPEGDAPTAEFSSPARRSQ